ncbi:MAG: HAD hydrolase-like protein [Clostridia bacterium]|nr:HAD hydrolase-like protein [Clostridia bacterium]
MRAFDYVILDFDGTVADTSEGIFDSVRYAVRMGGLRQPDDTEIRSFIGPPLSDTFHRIYPGLNDGEVTDLVIHYRSVYSVTGIYKLRLYDGMETMLADLKKAGVKIAIGSFKPEIFLESIVKSKGLDKYFDVVAGGSTEYATPGKEIIIEDAISRLGAVDRSRVLMVGDTRFDVIGAHKAGVACAAVLYGYGSPEEFEENNAEFTVKDCAQLEKLIIGDLS